MPRIKYILFNGDERVIDAQQGFSVMEAAVKNSVPGIDGDCGGSCSCATCHVYVDPAWQSLAGMRNDIEDSMLEFAENVQPNSRLSCQIRMTMELDGLVVRMPKSQR